jgi:osmotically-inducible protein OsmY
MNDRAGDAAGKEKNAMAATHTKSESVKKDVVDELYWDGRIDASRVQVEVFDGTVMLRGTVPSFSARRAAESDIRAIAGVESVDNRLSVERPTESAAGDREIAENIGRLLRSHVDIGSENIEITIEGGRVALKGVVSAYWKKVVAEDLAAGVAGVTDIDNRISVVPTKKVDDAIIADQIIRALGRHTDIDPREINVKVEDGRVTLSGFAPSLQAEQAASTIARNTEGVKDVVNCVQIRGH